MEIIKKNKRKVMVVNYKDKISFNELKKFKRTGGIGIVHASTGHENVSEHNCEELGLKQVWLDGYSTIDVAEFGVLLALQSSRMQIVLSNNSFTHKYVYKTGSRLNDKFALVIGSLGRIGSHLKQLLKAFGMLVLEYDSKPGYGFSEEQLLVDLSKADYIFLCINGEGNQRFFSKRYFGACKRKPVLINLVRKSLISDNVLREALNLKQISSYYVDDSLSYRFKDSFNVLATDHVGANTIEARESQSARVNRLVEKMFDNAELLKR